MARTVAIGSQDFQYLIENKFFYVDKTDFIREWWDSGDSVTLITRPRRFGKTLNMSMLRCFFSNDYAGRADLFDGLKVWEDEKFRALQGTYPVIYMTFAGLKGSNYSDIVKGIKKQVVKLFSGFPMLWTHEGFDNNERAALSKISEDMDNVDAQYSLNLLSSLLEKYYRKKVLIFLDEYDTPLQEAFVNGFWDEMAVFTRTMFNNTFKTNSSLERGLMTGITRVSKESIFSDLNNLNVVTTTSEEYAACFGFTEPEVFAAMDEQGISESEKQLVKYWYDGFTFGTIKDIYNPWSVISYLDKKKYDAYWANTSGNALVGKLVMEGSAALKSDFEELLSGGIIEAEIDEQIAFNLVDEDDTMVWSLLLASGYLKVESVGRKNWESASKYRLSITNHEVRQMFYKMVKGWFNKEKTLSRFVSAMLRGNVRDMNRYMNKVALNTFSYFDAAGKPSEYKEPERFYHGFVLGLLVDQAEGYIVKSNRESGYGRYDVVMEPKNPRDCAVIMEFKVFDMEDGEKDLYDTARSALKQINDKGYDTDLLQRGIPAEKILKYGFAFAGERCLICSNFSGSATDNENKIL